MITVYHYFGRFGEAFCRMLDDLGVKYDVLKAPFPEDMPPLVVFDLKDNAPRFEEQFAVVSMYAQPMAKWTKFTADEIDAAQWLAIFPHRHCVEMLNFEQAFCYCCSPAPYSKDKGYQHDQEQIEDLMIASIPKRTRTVFYAADTGFGEMFVDERIPEIVAARGIAGMRFRRTLDKKGRERSAFFQVVSDNIILRERVSLGHGEAYSECPCCYSKQIVLKDEQLLHLKGKPEELPGDFCMTERIFGEGIAHPYYLVSQRFYRILKENKMLGSVRAEPVCFTGE